MDLLFKNFNYFIDTYFSIDLWAFLLIYIICFVVLFLLKQKIKNDYKVLIIFEALYFDLLLVVTLFSHSREGLRDTIINPFYGMTQVFFHSNIHFIRGMLSNVVLFIPLGFIFSSFYKIRSIKKILLYTAIFSLIIELCQYVFRVGCFETEDILCNCLGAFLGFLCSVCLKQIINSLCNKN